jgi:glucose-1-phosphate cytidylyltransferase
MKALILAGGQGTRLREETEYRPKPMVHIGSKPILWHIMKIFHSQGIKDFEIALGFKGDQIKDYFVKYPYLVSDLSIDFSKESPETKIDKSVLENWTVGLNDTGATTNTGGRIFRLRDKLTETFICTYGDGVANVNVSELVSFHRKHGKIATVTAVHPSARFGSIEIASDGQVLAFAEKPVSNQWVNGGFFVFDPRIFGYLADDSILERAPLENLARDSQLMAWQHHGFWHPMDTIRDSQHLNELWDKGNAPWKVW